MGRSRKRLAAFWVFAGTMHFIRAPRLRGDGAGVRPDLARGRGPLERRRRDRRRARWSAPRATRRLARWWLLGAPGRGLPGEHPHGGRPRRRRASAASRSTGSRAGCSGRGCRSSRCSCSGPGARPSSRRRSSRLPSATTIRRDRSQQVAGLRRAGRRGRRSRRGVVEDVPASSIRSIASSTGRRTASARRPVGDQRAERAGVLRVVDRAHDAGADRLPRARRRRFPARLRTPRATPRSAAPRRASRG